MRKNFSKKTVNVKKNLTKNKRILLKGNKYACIRIWVKDNKVCRILDTPL